MTSEAFFLWMNSPYPTDRPTFTPSILIPERAELVHEFRPRVVPLPLLPREPPTARRVEMPDPVRLILRPVEPRAQYQAPAVASSHFRQHSLLPRANCFWRRPVYPGTSAPGRFAPALR